MSTQPTEFDEATTDKREDKPLRGDARGRAGNATWREDGPPLILAGVAALVFLSLSLYGALRDHPPLPLGAGNFAILNILTEPLEILPKRWSLEVLSIEEPEGAGGSETQQTNLAEQNGYTAVAVSPDGASIFAAANQTVDVWDRAGEFKGHLELNAGRILGLSFLAESGNILVITHLGLFEFDLSDDNFRKTVPSNSYEFVKPMRGLGGSVNVAMSPDQKSMAVASSLRGPFSLVDRRGNVVRDFTGSEEGVTALAFSEDGTRLVSGETGGAVAVWNVQDGRKIETFPAVHTGAVTTVAISRDGNTILTGSSEDRTAKILTLAGDQTALVENLNRAAVMVAFTPDEKHAVIGNGSGVHLVTLTGDPISTVLPVASDTFSNDADLPINEMAVARESGTIIAAGAGSVPVVTQLVGWGLALAPWTIAFSLLGLGFAHRSYVLWDGIVKLTEPTGDTVESFLQSDSPITDPAKAGTALKELTNRLSRFIRNTSTVAPFTFGLVGGWGSGKSSAMRLLEADLKRNQHPTVWFNAWHHQSEEHLFAALMEQIRLDAMPSLLQWRGWHWRNLLARARLVQLRVRNKPVRHVIQLFIVAFVLLLLAFVVPSLPDNPAPTLKEFLKDPLPTLLKALGIGGSGILVLLSIRDLTKPFKTRPAALLNKADRFFGTKRFEDKLGFRHIFASAFSEVCGVFHRKRLTILIDDLDRCNPGKVVDVLEAINFLVSSGDCFVVLGISEAPVKHAVGISFDKLAKEAALSKQAAGSQETELSQHKARADYAVDYLEKLINLRVPIPAYDAAALFEAMESSAQTETPAEPISRWSVKEAAPKVWRFLQVRQPLIFACLAIVLAVWMADRWSPSIVQYVANDHETAAVRQVVSIASLENNPTDTQTDTDTDTSVGDSTTGDEASTGGGENDPANLASSVDEGSWNHPIIYASVALFVIVFLIFDRRFRLIERLTDSGGRVEDVAGFKNGMRYVLPLVLHKNKTPRAMKRFSNRMRYLTGDWPNDAQVKLDRLLLLGAMDEINTFNPASGEALDSVLERLKTASDLSDEVTYVSKMESSLTGLKASDLKTYCELANSVRFSGRLDTKAER